MKLQMDIIRKKDYGNYVHREIEYYGAAEPDLGNH